jgi:uncharacterized protein (TIGR02246 family)
MKRIFCAVTALLFISTLSFAQADKKSEKKGTDKAASSAPKAGGGVDQALMDIERKWAAASLKNDAAVLEDILADSWSTITVDGKVETRAQSIDNFKKTKLTRSEVSEMKVRTIGPDAAIVTGVWTGMGTDAKGQKIDSSERWMDVFANQGGKWKCVASESTTIKK